MTALATTGRFAEPTQAPEHKPKDLSHVFKLAHFNSINYTYTIMTISREEQALFAKTILSLIESARDLKELEVLYEKVLAFGKNVGYDDNGIIFDLTEYLAETIRNFQGESSSGWDKAALTSLLEQLNDKP